ncbi:MAG: citrate lyase subunit alpha / citrate CoA-transferase [Thermoanaerobacteraceae bacterium]|nr:citrate lyase subunit alpha / citrate CoA-transferase [Thermoanaerobacteraceae bacterium]
MRGRESRWTPLINSVGRDIPNKIEGYKKVVPFSGAYSNLGNGVRVSGRYRTILPGEKKVLGSIREAIEKVGLKDGMTISFHHHLRNGDYVLNMVVDEIARMGIKDIKIAASSIFNCHEPLIEHIKNGVVTSIEANYIVGPVATAISKGILDVPVVMRSHGGRDRAIEAGELHIDVAFIAAPSADIYGNINGIYGPSACGSLGYSFSDARYADWVIAITDNLVSFPLIPISIDQTFVDYVVKVEKIGDPKGIVSGTTNITRDPVGLKIACMAADVIEASGLLKDGISFQTGAGGTSLAVASFLKQKMKEKRITGSFGLGGITGFFVEMLREGLFKALLDTQCFDLKAVESLREDRNHIEITSSMYGNPHNKGAVVNNLDVMILGATEIDTDFNVNVTTGSNGIIMGGSGGHNDTAAGSKLAVVVTSLIKGRLPIVVERVTTVTTPGETIDVLVTEYGIAVNPKNVELKKKIVDNKLPVVDIKELKDIAYRLCGRPDDIKFGERIVAIVEYRDGTVIDVIREVTR